MSNNQELKVNSVDINQLINSGNVELILKEIKRLKARISRRDAYKNVADISGDEEDPQYVDYITKSKAKRARKNEKSRCEQLIVDRLQAKLKSLTRGVNEPILQLLTLALSKSNLDKNIALLCFDYLTNYVWCLNCDAWYYGDKVCIKCALNSSVPFCHKFSNPITLSCYTSFLRKGYAVQCGGLIDWADEARTMDQYDLNFMINFGVYRSTNQFIGSTWDHQQIFLGRESACFEDPIRPHLELTEIYARMIIKVAVLENFNSGVVN